MSDRLFADCCYGTDWQHPESDECPQEVAERLTPNQRALLDDLCRCPGLFAGQYVYDGAGIEHLPRDLWQRSYKGTVYAMMDLATAYPSDLGLRVQAVVEHAL